MPSLNFSLTSISFYFFIQWTSYLYFFLYPQNTWNHFEGRVGVEVSLLFLRIRIFFLKQKIALLGSIKHLNSFLIFFSYTFLLLLPSNYGISSFPSPPKSFQGLSRTQGRGSFHSHRHYVTVAFSCQKHMAALAGRVLPCSNVSQTES